MDVENDGKKENEEELRKKHRQEYDLDAGISVKENGSLFLEVSICDDATIDRALQKLRNMGLIP